eukprot:TRINITY_DN21126_c0_g1_i1.p1 TRINITY_DN21126_c0_g1~~TRINITY_DN21126_c0_g1_i1.p1  ORF type:complete len:325 (+),score=53.20 TRINITY_DN21126_c0_g1_i1:81-1055(+)
MPQKKRSPSQPQEATGQHQRSMLLMATAVVVVLVAIAARNQFDDEKDIFVPADFTAVEEHVLTSPNFIQKHEIEHVLRLISENGGWEASRTGNGDWLVPKNQKKLASKFNQDPIIRDIELRVANYTGIQPHPHEDMLNVARILPRKEGGKIRGGYYFPHGLHHETDTRPHRSKTIIMYLKQPTSGGRTAFPLLGKRTRGAEDLEQDLQSQFSYHENHYSRHVSFDPTLDHPYNTHFEKTCRGQSAVSIEPKAGTAVMFHSSFGLNPKGDEYLYNLPAWHCGCNVLEGEKIIMTKFKEVPMNKRPRRSANMNDGQYIPWVDDVHE